MPASAINLQQERYYQINLIMYKLYNNIYVISNLVCRRMNNGVMTKIYNKLVRDKIPDIITANGERFKTRILNDEEHLRELIKKLKEEAAEFEENPSVEELADIKEITIAIREALGIHAGELEDARRKKAATNGRFKKKIFLESVEDQG